MEENMPYNDRFVAFLDILGFKNLIDKTSQNEKEFNRVLKVLKYTSAVQKDNYEGFLAQNEITKEVTVFSDSIVISYSADLSIGGALFNILNDLVFICNELLAENIFVRGGVSYGEMYHKNNICFGPAMIRAYLMEEKEAIYPRIIIDKNAIEADIMRPGECNTAEEEADYIRGLLNKDNEGIYYLNFLSQSNEFNDFETYETFIYKIRSYLISHYATNYPPKVKEKYIWFIRYFNKTIKKVFDRQVAKSFIIEMDLK